MAKTDKPLILVADDEPSTLALVANHLRSRGYRVIEATDGDEAWNLACAELPDVVVLDVMMPGMSGWEVCRKIREAVSLAHTGVVMLTGIGDTLNELTSPLYGADAYLDKPFQFSTLAERVETTLQQRSAGKLGRPKKTSGPTTLWKTSPSEDDEPESSERPKTLPKKADLGAAKKPKAPKKPAAKKAAPSPKKAAKKPAKKPAPAPKKEAVTVAPKTSKSAKKVAKKAAKKSAKAPQKKSPQAKVVAQKASPKKAAVKKASKVTAKAKAKPAKAQATAKPKPKKAKTVAQAKPAKGRAAAKSKPKKAKATAQAKPAKTSKAKAAPAPKKSKSKKK